MMFSRGRVAVKAVLLLADLGASSYRDCEQGWDSAAGDNPWEGRGEERRGRRVFARAKEEVG